MGGGGACGRERGRARNVGGEESALTIERARARARAYFFGYMCVCKSSWCDQPNASSRIRTQLHARAVFHTLIGPPSPQVSDLRYVRTHTHTHKLTHKHTYTYTHTMALSHTNTLTHSRALSLCLCVCVCMNVCVTPHFGDSSFVDSQIVVREINAVGGLLG